MLGLGQKHGRGGQEKCKSRTGALFLYILPVSAPMQYFVSRSRAGAGQEQGRSRAGAGQEKGRSRAAAGKEQGRSRSPNTKESGFF